MSMMAGRYGVGSAKYLIFGVLVWLITPKTWCLLKIRISASSQYTSYASAQHWQTKRTTYKQISLVKNPKNKRYIQ